MPILISVHCSSCHLGGLVVPNYSQLWLIRYGTGYCKQCQRFHHVPWPESSSPHCHLHPNQLLSLWQLGNPCPRCGGDLCEAPNELRIDLSVV
ncbi:MAG: hypothetical protein U0998_03015 [Moraxellaceae bacterium]|nr:hypothetical protein [Moraxellaceae bacterium]MDZ4386173.1 hypothetical protein [Moraxellaceae bacterium]